jgi:hypothetical protein
MPLGYNDGILLISLLYSSIDIRYEWESFSQCRRPIHQWLFVSFALVIIFRLTHVVGMQSSTSLGSGDFLLDLRQKDMLPRLLAFFTWLVALPFFMLWTLIGTKWLYDTIRETPSCVPTATHLWFSIFWLVLCYVWIIIHAALGAVAWVLERRVRRAEGDLAAIEDADVISRWGQVSSLQGYRSLSGGCRSGLSPEEIIALPSFTCCAGMQEVGVGEETECPICLHSFKQGDTLRQLDVCGHLFHRSCIDLWLLRSADCPLCKRNVKSASA